jgi:hypothetical protein
MDLDRSLGALSSISPTPSNGGSENMDAERGSSGGGGLKTTPPDSAASTLRQQQMHGSGGGAQPSRGSDESPEGGPFDDGATAATVAAEAESPEGREGVKKDSPSSSRSSPDRASRKLQTIGSMKHWWGRK